MGRTPPALLRDLDRAGRRLGFASTMRTHAAAQLVGLHPTDWAALDLLDGSGPLRIGALARGLGLSRPAATALVDRLAARGLVERRADEADRRSVVVVATGDRGDGYAGLDRDLRRAMAANADTFTRGELEVVLRFMRGASEILERVTEQHRGPSPR
jgi:DNA-binding MarR family transcriptional regulator